MIRRRIHRWMGPVMAAVVAMLGGCGGDAPSASTPALYGGAPGIRAESVQASPAPMAGDILASQRDDDGQGAGSEEGAKAPPPPPSVPAPTAVPVSPATDKPAPGPGAVTTPVGQDRRSPILIYKADFTMSVYEVEKAVDAVQSLAETNGGYLARRDDRSITIRVPAGSFQGVVVEIAKLGDVTSRNVVSEDVTAEFRDLEVQLQNQLAMRDRFQKLLEKAQKVEEALAIERELGRVTEEIERIKGRLKLLSDLASYSTITVRFAPRVDQQIQQGPFVLPLPWLNNLGLPRLLSL